MPIDAFVPGPSQVHVQIADGLPLKMDLTIIPAAAARAATLSRSFIARDPQNTSCIRRQRPEPIRRHSDTASGSRAGVTQEKRGPEAG